MADPGRKLLIVQVAALGYDFLVAHQGEQWEGLRFQPAESVFPAVTCPVQASFRTATAPAEHGMIANGLFLPELRRPLFWEQSSALVSGRRIWDTARERGKRIGMLFWQQSLGESVDVVLSPAPIHKHHGGMIQDCYSQPSSLYARLCASQGRRFNLMHYWGPLASAKSSQWIASATATLMGYDDVAPEVCLVYLPALDYDLQRFGLDHARSRRAAEQVLSQLQTLLDASRRHGYQMLVFGDYAMAPVDGPVAYPNRVLAEAGLMAVRTVGGMHYPDFHSSRAFAMVDHQIAHVFVRDAADTSIVRDSLCSLPGVDRVLDAEAQQSLGMAHPRCGQLVLVAETGSWFAYPWWTDKRQAPDYAGHVDIHNKPGYDPCELFFGWPPWKVGQDPQRIRGTHGLAGPQRRVAWASTMPLEPASPDLVGLAAAARGWMEENL